MEEDRIVLIGAGNLAWSLGSALVRSGHSPLCVWSRGEESACSLASHLHCSWTTDVAQLPQASLYIVSVRDEALPALAQSIVTRSPSALWVHTAGSMPMELWRNVGALHYGVLYPLQTFTRGREKDFTSIPIFVEAATEEDYFRLETLSRSLSSMVYRADGEQRKHLHLAAVFASNFVNAMYRMASQLCEEHSLPFEALLPLIDETAAKVHSLLPSEAQTGPAARGDEHVMEAQTSMLQGEWKDIYNCISSWIMKNKR